MWSWDISGGRGDGQDVDDKFIGFGGFVYILWTILPLSWWSFTLHIFSPIFLPPLKFINFKIQTYKVATDLWLSFGQLHQCFWLSGDSFGCPGRTAHTKRLGGRTTRRVDFADRNINQPCQCGVRSTALQTLTIAWLVKGIMNFTLPRFECPNECLIGQVRISTNTFVLPGLWNNNTKNNKNNNKNRQTNK